MITQNCLIPAESMGKLNSIFVIILRFLKLSEIFPKVFLSPYLNQFQLFTMVYPVHFSITELHNLSVSGELVRWENAKNDSIFLESVFPSQQDNSVINLKIIAVTLSYLVSIIKQSREKVVSYQHCKCTLCFRPIEI